MAHPHRSFADEHRLFALRKRCTLAVQRAMRGSITSYREYKLADRLFFCGSKRKLTLRANSDGSNALVPTWQYACKSLLCPECERRRSDKERRKARQLLDRVWAEDADVRFVFLTLTMRNVPFAQLENQLGAHDKALNAFWRRKRIKTAVLGHLGAIEIAVRGTEDEPEAGVHSHHLVAVPWDYFSSNKYLTNRQWQAEFKQAAKLNYRPIVDVRVPGAKGDLDDRPAVLAAIREVTKYVVAPQSLFDVTDNEVAVNARLIGPLLAATYRRRFIRMAGVFTEAARLIREEREERGS